MTLPALEGAAGTGESARTAGKGGPVRQPRRIVPPAFLGAGSSSTSFGAGSLSPFPEAGGVSWR